MKTFDCSKCKNKQNGPMHCLFYQNQPNIDVCSGFQQETLNNHDQILSEYIKRRAVDLLCEFQKLDYSFSDWFAVVKSAVEKSNSKDLQRSIWFIRSFGLDGVSFACDNCGNVVELEDDTDISCPACRKSKLVILD